MRVLALLVSLVFAPSVCASQEPPDEEREPVPPRRERAPWEERAERGERTADDEAVAALVEASNDFGWRLHASLPPEENALVCPFPALLELEKLRLAATGETRAEIDAAVPLPEGVEARHFAELLERLESVRDTEGTSQHVLLPTAFWADERSELRDTFLREVAALTGEAVRRIDFGDADAAAADLLAWSEGALGEGAREIDPPPVETLVFGISVLDVQATWARSLFTWPMEPMEFRVSEGVVRIVEPMGKFARFPYAEDEHVQTVAVDATGGIQWMVVLPRDEVSLRSIEVELPNGLIDAYRERLEFRMGFVSVPRFRVQAEPELADSLRRLGVRRAFDPSSARFGDLDGPSFVACFGQRAWLEIDENGISGGSRTYSGRFGGEVDPFEFTADRPFVFVVRHESTGLVLFSGRLWDPARARVGGAASESADEPSER